MQSWFTFGLVAAAGLPAMASALMGTKSGAATPWRSGLDAPRPLGLDVPRGHLARVLREVNNMTDAANGGQPDDSQWSLLTGIDRSATAASMQRMVSSWDATNEPVLDSFVSSNGNVTWVPTNLTLFGDQNQALAGGVEAALQAVTQSRLGTPRTAACAVVLAQRPDLVAGAVRRQGDQALVRLFFKTEPLPGAFTPFTLAVPYTTPDGGDALAQANALPRNQSTWCTMARKAMSKVSSNADGPLVTTFSQALSALSGLEVESVDVTRLGEVRSQSNGGNLPTDVSLALSSIPAVKYDVTMQRLVRGGLGGIVFARSNALSTMKAYNDTSKAAEWLDGASARAIANTSAIHLTSPRDNVDVVLVDGTVYGVLGVKWKTSKDTNQTRPISLTLYDPAGGAPNPALADILTSADLSPAQQNTSVVPVFDVPINLAKRLPWDIYTV